jgi:hypothetical protein
VDPIQLKTVDSLSGGSGSVNTEEEDTADAAVGEVTKERRKLDIELEQTGAMLARKADNAERAQLIENELKLIHREFYCEWCDKQYKNVSEVSLHVCLLVSTYFPCQRLQMASHLDSYDHHHAKVFNLIIIPFLFVSKEIKRPETSGQEASILYWCW